MFQPDLFVQLSQLPQRQIAAAVRIAAAIATEGHGITEKSACVCGSAAASHSARRLLGAKQPLPAAPTVFRFPPMPLKNSTVAAMFHPSLFSVKLP